MAAPAPLNSPTPLVLPSTASVVLGSSTNYVVYLTSALTTFSQLATLSTSGLPSGVTVTFTPEQITAGATSTLNLNLSGSSLTKNRPVILTDPLGRPFNVAYDADDEIVNFTSPTGRTAQYAYDPRGQLATSTDALGGVASFGHDSYGNLTSVTDQRGFATSYGYDALQRPLNKIDPLGASTNVTYDAQGNLLSATDRLARNVTLSYDQIYRLTQATYADATVTYAYDSASRPTQINDTQSGTVNWTYDNANRLLTETTAAGSVSYAYNSASQLTSMTPAGRASAGYAYDSAGRLQTITQGSDVFTYGYDSISRVTSLQRPNGITTNYGYDAASQGTRLQHLGSAGQSVEDFAFTYNADGKVTGRSSLANTVALPPVGSAAAADGANRITQFGATSYTFDAEGQTASRTDPSGATQYQFDGRGRTTSATLPSGSVISYSYDAVGRLASRTANGATTTYLYDGFDVVLDQNGDGSLTDYLNGPGIDNKLKLTSGSSPLYFLQDQIGSTTALTDSSGNIAEQQQYDSFGGGPGSALTRYDYAGRERDPDTGLIYCRVRWYDPAQGRFITQDPIGFGGGLNSYAYAGEDPIAHIDPLGLQDGPQNYMRDPLPPQHWIINGLSNTVSDVLGLDDIAQASWVAGDSRRDPTDRALAATYVVARGAESLSYSNTVAEGIAGKGVSLAGRVADAAEALGGPAGRVAGRIAARCRGLVRGAGGALEAAEGPCFVAGTLVKTPEGDRPIENIQVGDAVLSTNPEEGDSRSEAVTRIMEHTVDSVVDIRVGDETITCTPSHRFWVDGRGWLSAKDLTTGSPLVTVDGNIAIVGEIKQHHGPFKVYNLEVSDLHTYYVGAAGILVHNDCTDIAEALQREKGGGAIARVKPQGAPFLNPPAGGYPPGTVEAWHYHDAFIKEGIVYDPMMGYPEGVPFSDWWSRWNQPGNVVTRSK